MDPIRLRWSGVGNTLLGLGSIFGTHGSPAGIIFGLLFLGLAGGTWAVTRFGTTIWPELTSAGKAVAGIGSLTGLLFIYSFFIWLVVLWWFLKLFLSTIS